MPIGKLLLPVIIETIPLLSIACVASRLPMIHVIYRHLFLHRHCRFRMILSPCIDKFTRLLKKKKKKKIVGNHRQMLLYYNWVGWHWGQKQKSIWVRRLLLSRRTNCAKMPRVKNIVNATISGSKLSLYLSLFLRPSPSLPRASLFFTMVISTLTFVPTPPPPPLPFPSSFESFFLFRWSSTFLFK